VAVLDGVLPFVVIGARESHQKRRN
jgi:hypothetical protein